MPTDRQFETDNGTTRHDYAPTSFYRADNPLLAVSPQVTRSASSYAATEATQN